MCGGLAEYFGVDPLWIRFAFVVATPAFGAGLVLYAALWISIPEEATGGEEAEEPPLVTGNPKVMAGIVLVAGGLLLFLWKVLFLLGFQVVAAIVLVGSGLFLLASRDR